MNELEARTLVETMAREYPGAYRLAQVVSIAVRIEPELLRSVRLRLLPEVEAGAEADLWFSSLVQSQSPLAMTFLPEVVAVLREKLVEDQALLQGAGKLLEEFHRNAPPALRLEEEVTWLALSGAANSDLIRKRLESVSAAILQDKRPGLVRWATRALPSLPARARDSDAAHILALVATVPETQNLPTSSGHATVNERLTQIITQSLPKVEVGIRLFKKDANGAGERKESAASTSNEQAIVVEFSYPPRSYSDEADVIEVPQTNPVLIEVSWQGEVERNSERVSLQEGQSQLLEVRSGELSIRTALGDLHNLQPRMDFDFFLHYNLADRNWAISLVERLKREEHEGRELKVYIPVVSGDPDQSVHNTFELPFFVSRKVGLVLSPESAEQDWKDIQEFSTWRIHPPRLSDWIIPIYHRPCEVPETLKSVPAIDLGDDSDFEQGYKELLSAITNRRELISELETQSEPVLDEADVSTLPAAEETTNPVKEKADESATLTAEEAKPKRVKRKAAVSPKPRETALNLFVSYVHQDKQYLDKFLPHLKLMEREGTITVWHDPSIVSGSEWEVATDQQLKSAQIILLFISANYLASDFANAQMNRALELHKNKKAVVVPVLVRPASWQRTPLAELQILPKGARPITMWPNRDAAYVDVTNGIRKVIEQEDLFRDKESLPRSDKQPAIFRWPVRTATDEDIGKIKPDVVGTTIKALAKQSRPSDMPLKTVRAPKYQTRRVPPVETTKWSVEANIVAYKLQTSGGYRLTLKGEDGTTMIAVAQDPAHLSQSTPFAKAMASAVQTLTKRFEFGRSFVSTEVAARVVGLGFFNRWHAQSAGAPNAVELQPLLEIEWLSETSTRPSSGTDPFKQSAVTIELQIHRLPGSDSGIDGKKLVQDFARINPGLKLTIVSLSKSIRGRSKLLARVEGPSLTGKDFTIAARDALSRTILRLFPGRITPHKGGLAYTVQELESPTKKSSVASKPIRKGKKKAAPAKKLKKR